MKLTKYDHACVVIEDQGKALVIDPGSFVQASLKELTNVVAIVVTHMHADHYDDDHLKTLQSNNPTAQLFSTQEVAEIYKDGKVSVVTGGSVASAAPFDIKFFGGKHAVIHASYPPAQNIGVLVNDSLYYPGDSFTEPGVPVKTLMLPISAPWLKYGESMDFAAKIRPQLIIPTHNALNSPIAEGMAENMIGNFVKGQGSSYQFVPVGESIEI